MIFPNRENIDRWLFDYTEGNLSSEQESLLENYILNNPDLEVDLESWQDAKVQPIEIEYKNQDKLKKRRKLLPFYIIGLFLILGIVGINSISYFQNKNELTKTAYQNAEKSSKHEKIEQKVSKIKLSESSKNNSEKTIDLKHYSSDESLLSRNNDSELKRFSSLQKTSFNLNSISLTGQQHFISSELNNKETTDLSSINIESTNHADKISTDWNIIHLKYKPLASLHLDLYDIRNEELHYLENNEPNEIGGLTLGNINFIRKIEKVLEKDLGLSNIPDHTYTLPEYSNIDALFSNIGATSQLRFQSVTSARWIESETQRKFTQQITLDGYSRGAQSGFGFQANYDYFANGSIQNWNTCLLFSPKIALTKSISFEPAMRFKIGNKILSKDRIQNLSNVTYESFQTEQFNFDSSLAIGNKLWYRDLDLGFTINTPYFYFGGQVTNILRHNNNIYSNYVNLDMRASNVYNAVLGTQYISRNQKIQFSPYVFLENRNNQNRIYGGFSFKFYKLMVGGSYGTGKTTSATLGLSTNNFSLLAQTSYGNSIALNSPSFTHQLTLRINSNIDKKSRRYITF